MAHYRVIGQIGESPPSYVWGGITDDRQVAEQRLIKARQYAGHTPIDIHGSSHGAEIAWRIKTDDEDTDNEPASEYKESE